MRNQPLYSQDLTLVLERCVFSHVCSWTIPSCRHMCALYVRVLQNTNSQFLWSFSRPVSFRSMAEFGERLWRFREGYSHTYEPPQSSHFYPATKYNFTHFPASKYFYLPCCLWENMNLVTTGKINLQRRKSSGMRHENHMDFFFPFSLILPPSLSLPALCQLIKSREQVRGLSWSCCYLSRVMTVWIKQRTMFILEMDQMLCAHWNICEFGLMTSPRAAPETQRFAPAA